ncbi:hypothetical protein S40288_03229 [Stachybotrys chartarum IBT 40288]|nr:hypothetical protein S40288_03229 [Stachybotrys chartarum IBT 40288]
MAPETESSAVDEANETRPMTAESTTEAAEAPAQADQHQEPIEEDGGAEPEGPAPANESSLCGVCLKEPPKYKCPRCYLPYCSVACNRTHRENHPPDPTPGPQPEHEPAPATASTINQHPAEPADPNNPFRALDSSDKLRLLFAKYPSLPDQLLKIHAATQPPTEANSGVPAALLKGLPPRHNRWNRDLGVKKGKEALRRARKAAGEEGAGVREYTELILHLMNGSESREDMSSLLKQQTDQQDLKLIEQMMAEEKY